MTPSPYPTDLSPERAVAAISRWLAVESPTDSAEGVNRMMDLVAGRPPAWGSPPSGCRGGTVSATT